MYIEQGYKGLHEGWRYFLGIFIVFILWQFIGGLPLIAALIIKSDSLAIFASGDLGTFSKVLGSNLFLFLMLLSFAIGLFFLFLIIKFFHKQSITSFTTSRPKVDWKRVFFSFLIWGFLSAAFVFIDILLEPQDYQWNFELIPFLILFLIALLMIPIQTSMEEYYIRGYMMQGIGIVAKNRWIPLITTSLIFGLMHLFNPEVSKLGYGILVFYIGTGFLLGIMTLMDEGLELALGFHAANNLITALLVTADWTAFQTNSLYRDVSDPSLGWDVFIPILVIYPILLFLLAKKYKWTNWKNKLFGPVVIKELFLTAQNTQDEL